MIVNPTKITTALLLSATLYSPLSASNTNEELVNSIIALRGDVENLYTDIKENKQRYNAQMKSLSMQITDSQAQINRKTTTIKLAKNELEKIKLKIEETATGNPCPHLIQMKSL